MSDKVTKVGSARTICKRLAELAQDEEHRKFIVRDGGCLSGLVRYLTNEDAIVQIVATQTVKLLASAPENRASLCGQPNLLNSLIHVKLNAKGRAKDLATEALEFLQHYINKQETEVQEGTHLSHQGKRSKKKKSKKKKSKSSSSTSSSSHYGNENASANENTSPSEPSSTPSKAPSAGALGVTAAAASIATEKRKVRTTSLTVNINV